MSPEDRQLRQLLTWPREDLSIELKGWLNLADECDRANLAKALLALANSGGGYAVLGYTESEGRHVPSPQRPSSLAMYCQDTVNEIVRRYAEPSFHCEVHHVVHPVSDEIYPIVVVPGGHRVPIRAKSEDPARKHVRLNAYYVRRPGPSSDQPQTGREWDELLRRCILAGKDELLASIRLIMHSGVASQETAPHQEIREKVRQWENSCVERWTQLVGSDLCDEEPSRYKNGIWTASYCLEDQPERPGLSDLLSTLEQVSGHETGWPPWWVPSRTEIRPYPIDNVVECWMKDTYFGDGAHSDFWRASPSGMLFLLRGYQEDSVDAFDPGTVLVVTSPLWEVAEILLHVSRLARAFSRNSTSVVMRFRWAGLAKRVLSCWPTKRRAVPHRQCRQESVESEVSIQVAEIRDSLPEKVLEITRPLYEAFDFFSLPNRLVEEEIAALLKNTSG